MRSSITVLLFAASLAVFLFPSIGFAGTTYEIHLVVSQYVYGPAENVSIIGYVRNVTSNDTANVTSFVASAAVSVSILTPANATVSNYTFTTDANGSFYSRSSFYPSATAILSPTTPGTYSILANYTQNGTGWTAGAHIVVASTDIDDIQFQLPKVNFYPGENIPITARAVRRVGDSSVAVANVSINVTVRSINETIITNLSCTTGATGACNLSTTAPSSAGTYILEANNFVGFTNFRVVAFDVEAYVKDSSALTFKNIFARGEAGFVEIRVSYNSTTPNGTYNATAVISNSTGFAVQNLSSVILNSTNGFVDKLAFTVTSTMTVGFYTVNVSVAETSGSTVNTTTSFQVRDWSLSLTKASKDSGFEYGYTTFTGTRLFFDAHPVNRSNGTTIENATNNFTVQMKNALGSVLSNATVAYNASCGGRACYQFNLTAPSAVGDFTVFVALNFSDDYQTAERTIKVTDITASAQPSDSEGSLKEQFGTNELVYITLTGKNTTTNISISQAEVANVIYENGTKLNYSQGNISSMNLSDTTLQWVFNTSSSRLILDPPSTGGTYIIEIYVNNKAAALTTRLGINPYDVCTSAKASADTSTSDYWYQFRTSDTVYFQVKVSEAQNTAGRATSVNHSGHGSIYGRSSQCSFDSTTKRSINNATVVIEKVLNTQSGKTETLNSTASTCTGTDSSGGYICTVQANDSTWDGGRYMVTFSVLGDDNVTSDKATGFFEARAFYIYGYSTNWANKATSNITLNINVYEAGSGWWNSNSGLSGTAVVDSINYYGGMGEWIWPPIKYDYNVTGLNITISNGVGTATLPVNRTSSGRWGGGFFSAVIKVTVNDQVDYGEAWFSIRNWDTYAVPVEIKSDGRFDSENSINSKKNATLYVKITEAGDYTDFSGGRAIGGNITISVKKLIDYSQWPAAELLPGNFTATAITVNASSPWYSSANLSTHAKYLLNVSPASGTWESGYYTAILDVNATESGYGWFNVISFYIFTQPTNANGTGYVYNSKGDGPVYFNVTTTESQKFSYKADDYVNTTITEMVLRTWDSSTYTQREFKYPTDINVTPLLVNGSAIVSVTRLAGNWPSGYYYGEVKMRSREDNSTSRGWIWFAVQPFRVTSQTNSYNVGTRENVTVNISVQHPDWSNTSLLNGNYTIASVKETSWSGGTYRITNLNFTFTNSSGIFNNRTALNILPAGGKWTPGYKSGTIVVRDTNSNSTQEAWFSFRATSFTDIVTRTSSQNTGPSDNVTVNITLTSPAGGAASGNLSSAFYWGYPSKVRYRFRIGGCDSNASATCFINGSAIATILSPSDGWREGYNYIYFEYVEQDDSTARIESYSTVYFYVRQPLTGYMYAVGPSAGSQSDFGEQENVTMFVYSLQNLTGQGIAVNVTNVQTAKTESHCWTDSCRSYSNATWQVMVFANGSYATNGSTMMNGSGYVRINASGGTWNKGDYSVKVFVTQVGTSSSGIIKDTTFRIKDKRGVVINITSPTVEQAINATSFWVNATTSEKSVCYISIYDYGQYDRQNCGNSTNSTLPAACNSTKYNNATTYYAAWANKWYNQYGSALYTDSETHYYRHTDLSNMAVPQNYTVHVGCYDEDWNWATNATTFYLTGRGNLTNGTGGGNGTSNATTITINITSPANTTYTTANITLNYTATGSPSACWYRLNAGSNVSLAGCANTTFIASGASNIAVHANNSTGGVFTSNIVYFTANTSSGSGTITLNITLPANTTYSSANRTLNYTITGTPSACWYRLNAGSNVSLGSSCVNTTFTASEGHNNITAFANNSTGSVYNSSTVFFTANASGGSNGTSITINITSPANTTYNTFNTTLNYTVNGSASSCWYRLNAGGNTTLPGCAAVTFSNTGQGENNVTVYANNSTGAVFNSSTVFFSVDTIAPSINYSSTTVNNATVSVNFTMINATLSEAPAAILFEFNGTNYTMSNTSSLAWYRNHTVNASGNYTFSVHANDTAGNVGVTPHRWVYFNLT